MLETISEWKYPHGWPPQKFLADHSQITEHQVEKLEELISKRVKETVIDEFLRSNPNIFVHCIRPMNTGHHGAWIIPQQSIRMSMAGVHRGLIPDYILGGRSSDGFSWFILELKGVDDFLFSETRSKKQLTLSSVANKAVCQTLEYIDYCSSIQSHLRDSLKLSDFREPKGLILIGREDEFADNERRETLKSAWNRYLGGKIEIRTYDSLLRYAKAELPLVAQKIKAKE